MQSCTLQCGEVVVATHPHRDEPTHHKLEPLPPAFLAVVVLVLLPLFLGSWGPASTAHVTGVVLDGADILDLQQLLEDVEGWREVVPLQDEMAHTQQGQQSATQACSWLEHTLKSPPQNTPHQH